MTRFNDVWGLASEKKWWKKKRSWFCCVARRSWKLQFLNPTNLHWKHWRFCNNMEKVACHVMSDCFYLLNITACHISITLCHVPSNHMIMSYPYHRLMTWGSLGTYQGGLRWLQNVEGHMPRVTKPRRTEKPWLFIRCKNAKLHEVKHYALFEFFALDSSLHGNFLSEEFFKNLLVTNTVDGWNPASQLWLVVYPIIYKFLYIPGGCFGFQPSTVSLFCAYTLNTPID